MNSPFDDSTQKIDARLEKVDLASIEFERYKAVHYVGTGTAEYTLDAMRFLKHGSFFAVPNFRGDSEDRFSLFELVDFRPLHFGAQAVSLETLPDLRREVFEKVSREWFTGSSSAYVLLRGNQINYELVVTPEGYRFEDSWSYPLIGGKIRFLSADAVSTFINASLPQSAPPLCHMSIHEEIGVRLDLAKLVEFHFGVFAYTGGGKSNLVSHIVRTLISNTSDVKVVIYDIAGEYAVNLADILSAKHGDAGSLFLTEERFENADELASRLTVPTGLSDKLDSAALRGFCESMISQGKMGVVAEAQHLSAAPEFSVTYADILSVIQEKIEYYSDKNAAACRILQYSYARLTDYMEETGKHMDSGVGEELGGFLDQLSADVSHRTVTSLVDELRELVKVAAYKPKPASKPRRQGYTEADLVELLNSDNRVRLVVVSFVDTQRLKRFLSAVSTTLLRSRRSRYMKKPIVLSVFDEAQEVIPRDVREDDVSRFSSYAVEQLLRQGRKYGLGGAIATQRLAYLNTNVLQQLHTYFVGTLPRPYDRTTISDQFAIDPSIVDRTLTLRTGEWLVSSYVATGVRNIPLFVKAPNNEHVISETFKRMV